MGSKDRLRRLRRAYEKEMTISIPQPDGTEARFHKRDLAAAYLSAMDRASGEDVPDHPLCQAARRSPDSAWSGSLYAGPAVVPDPPPDLSE